MNTTPFRFSSKPGASPTKSSSASSGPSGGMQVLTPGQRAQRSLSIDRAPLRHTALDNGHTLEQHSSRILVVDTRAAYELGAKLLQVALLNPGNEPVHERKAYLYPARRVLDTLLVKPLVDFGAHEEG